MIKKQAKFLQIIYVSYVLQPHESSLIKVISYEIVIQNNLAADFMIKDWRSRAKSHDETDFIDYFEAQWLIKERGWYESFSKYISNNNGLEVQNNKIKVI